MDLATFERLLADEGQALIAEVTARAGIESDLALGTRLRKSYDVELVAAAVTQAHLRGKARAKFGDDAARMYFTHDSLEQSTRSVVAAHRSARLAASAASVVDLGCGIGGDLIAFARAGMRVRGIDLDEVRATIARANLAALGLTGTVVVGDATGTALGDDEATFIDPARRDGAGRKFDPRAFQPPWDVVTRLLETRGVAKTMPGIAHDLVPLGVEAEWVSDGGDLVEACLWGRDFATVERRVTVLPTGATLTDADDPGDHTTHAVGDFLYEPDDAVGRAGLVTAVAAAVGGWIVDPHIAYVSSDALHQTPFATAYRVLEELPFREKQLKAALRAHDVGPLTIKKRGVDIVPERLRKTLGLTGSHTATIVMTRVEGTGRAYLVERI
ncbi:class I SAM-dependent methyltransferase [soil metagenome]